MDKKFDKSKLVEFLAYPKVIPYVGGADMERKSREKLRLPNILSFDFFQFESL